MTKILHCRDAGFDCDAVVRGETVEEILDQVGPHAAAEHRATVTPALADSLRAMVREE